MSLLKTQQYTPINNLGSFCKKKKKKIINIRKAKIPHSAVRNKKIAKKRICICSASNLITKKEVNWLLHVNAVVVLTGFCSSAVK